ncbi:hypothetical protein C2E23DRAFT_892031 [Lenzites betulinus]|nr:hypothetical protein C2E23DRAFT_892031 [Lenzites betulinus]
MWPEKILRQFAAMPQNPTDSDFHGPYNKLLYTLFPADTDFVVVPPYTHAGDPRTSSDFIVMFELQLANKPILIFQAKPQSHREYPSKRQAADLQIRERMNDLAAQYPLSTLHAVSALGTGMCFYTLDTGDVEAEISPVAIPAHPTRMNDIAPASRWDCDLLQPEGERRLREIVEEIKAACVAIIDDEA